MKNDAQNILNEMHSNLSNFKFNLISSFVIASMECKLFIALKLH